MASAEGGYECDFVSKVPEDYICVVCLHALKDPVQVADCGHRLCKPCYNQLKDDAEARNGAFLCPLDREVINTSQVFNDKAVARKVSNLIVRCCFKDKECFWTGELRHLQMHEKSCPKNPTNVSEKTISVLSFAMEQLQKEMLKKDHKIEEYKKLVDHLQTCVEEFQTTIDGLLSRMNEYDRVIKKEKDMATSTLKTSTYEWVVPFESLKHGKHFSDSFYTASTIFCFQLCAYLENNRLSIYLHRCRGVNDNETGRIKPSLDSFMFIIYMIRRDGKLQMREGSFNLRISDFNIKSNYQRSIGSGWSDFLNGESLPDWLIKGRLHIFCRIDLKKE